MKRPIIKYLILTLLCIISIITVYRIFFSHQGKDKYIVTTVRQGRTEQKILATGEVNASQLVTVGSQASGQIKKLHVQIGQKIQQSDLIAEIDSTTQQNTLDTNRAILETYKAQFSSRKVALATAQRQYDREAKLKRQDATSRENLENAENSLAKAKADVAETQSLITQSKIAVDTAEANLGYTRIIAPISGTVVSMPVEEGQTLNAAQLTPTIIQLADLERMKIKLQISEGDVTKISPGLPVIFQILSAPEDSYTATLQSIDPAPTSMSSVTQNDTGSVNTNTNKAIYYYGTLLVDNKDGKLRIGMTAQCSIKIVSAENVLTVPSTAIQQRGNEKYVLLLAEGDKTVERIVKTGLSDSMNTAILSGLQEGEKVILSQMTGTEIEANLDKVR